MNNLQIVHTYPSYVISIFLVYSEQDSFLNK